MPVAPFAPASVVVSAFARASVGVVVAVPGSDGWRADFVNTRARELFGELQAVPGDLGLLPQATEQIAEWLASDAPSPLLVTDIRIGRRALTGPVRISGARVTISGTNAAVLFVFKDAAPRMEQALAETEARFRMLLDVAPDAVVFGTRGRFQYANPSFARALGYRSAQEVTSRKLKDLLHHDDQPLVRRAITELLETSQPFHLPLVRCHRKDGTLAEFDVRGLTMDWSGEVAMLGIAHDLTERRRVQAQLIRADRLASMGTLAAGVAHEINNPLAYLMLNLQYLIRELPRYDGSAARLSVLLERLAEADHGARRVSSIVGDLRAFAQRDDMERGPVDVVKAVTGAVKVTANQLCHRARVVETYAPESFVEGNAVRLEQVFVNLLINAAQAIPEGSADRNEVHISVTHEGASIVVEVRDTGSGIPPHVLGRVFDPFFTTKPRGLGTGLGLPISRSIVAALGGEITVASTPGLGTTFRVSLPSLPVPDDRPSGRPLAADEVRAEAPFRARLLVVDDEPLVADMLRRALADTHDVTVATDAQTALQHILGGQAFDLIFCDLLMPRMSGMDLYARLETERPGVQQRIVFMTGGAFTERASQFLADVKNPKLAKPFDLKTLEGLVLKTVTALGRA